MSRRLGMLAALMLVAGAVAPAAASAAPTRRAASSSTGVSPATALPSATAASAPTLGLRQRFTEGFGRVRPRTVSYGGDPTSLVARVHWRSWGGARAWGTGVADWVWPGWCVACGSEELRATVVAFGLSTCAGHPAYTHVEWYFPARGMTFSPRLGTENLCHPRARTHVTEPPHAHCAPVRIPGAYVDKLQVFGYGVRCPAARALVPHLDLLRHYGHNARFHVGRWWCGSELSMQLHRIPPQDFSCESGDDDQFWFSVARTG
ncbi:MAG TPA: hypothetical protein VKV21_02015 [Solirubrobacteraceae bacterium]|nr:hypothetical protein [Solirubrobacteraceae bacterium]